MYEPPADLQDETLCAWLHARYGLAAVEVTFLPVGYDSSAWVYRVQTADGTPYFLKVRRCVNNVAGLLVPRYLQDQGIARVIAPLLTTTQTVWTAVDGYALILYPFVAGTSGKDHGMAPAQWIAYGTMLRELHATFLPPDLVRVMRHETFVPEGAGPVRDLEAHIGTQTLADPEAQRLATFWRERREEIHTLLARAEELGQRLARRAPASVLCHADIHTANLLLDTTGQVWIVDWDETVLAPRERDLMFVAGGGIDDRLVGPHEEELFFRGYGATTLDPLALAYYRYAWAVSDIGAFGAEIVFRPDLCQITRRAAVESFMSLFLPGQIVARAFTSPAA